MIRFAGVSLSSLSSFDNSKQLRRQLGIDNGIHNVSQLLNATKALVSNFAVCAGSTFERTIVSRASEFGRRPHIHIYNRK